MPKVAFAIGILSLVVGGACCRTPSTASGLPIVKTPLWVADLRPEGFAGDEWHAPAEFEANRQIAFGSNEELVVASASGPFSTPNVVQAFVLKTADGRVVGRATWESNNWPFLFATLNGQYAVVTNAGMELLGAGLKKTGTVIPKVAADKASPDGRSLAVSRTISGHCVVSFIDAATLKPSGTEIRDMYAWSVGNNRIVVAAVRSGKTIVEVGDGLHLTEYESECNGARPQFVSQNIVALLGCGTVEVVSIPGGRVFLEQVTGAPTYSIAASRNGNRFAVSQQFERPGDPATICAERFTVFDVRLRRPLFVTETYELQGFTAGHSSGYAISPDGNMLAVNSAGRVRLFALPVE